MYEHLKFSLAQFIQCGFESKVKQLCTSENVNKALYLGRTPLHIAVICSQISVIKYLLTQGASLQVKDQIGITPGQYALYLRNKHVQQILLPQIPYTQVKDLMLEDLDIFRCAEVCSKGLEQKIRKQNPHIKSAQFDRNALHWAALSGNKESWEILINQKVNPYAQDVFGFNAFHYLRNNKFNVLYELVQGFPTEQENQTDYEVIVIGAGASGIGAAITLQRAGVPYIVIQARNRIGGRLQSAMIDKVQVDLGACWVHSYNKNNAICKQVKRIGWKPKQAVNHYGAQIVDEKTGNIPHKVMAKAQFHSQRFFQISQKNARQSEFDISIYQAAQEYYNQQIEKQDNEVKRVTDMLINMTEHYEAASITQLSGKNYDQRVDSGGDFSPRHSYASLIQKIASGLKVQLNTKVKQIEWEKNRVKVLCDNQKIYTARKVICSLPLGILKAGTTKFSPQLPEQHRISIQRLGFGVMNKIIMAFEQPFWNQGSSWIRIACEERGKYPCMYNFSKNEKHILCCFVTDNFARKISQWTDKQIINDISQTLAKSFKGKTIGLKEVKITRWNKDPLALGSYTHFRKNSSIKDCYKLRENIKETIWIIGEHCYGQHIGTAHGAFQTGVWASEEIIKTMKHVKKIQQEHRQQLQPLF